jgi:hypothetical protein
MFAPLHPILSMHNRDSANRAPVGVFFADGDVASIFAELLEVQGVPVEVLASPGELAGHTRVITEPRYVKEIAPDNYPHCLVVGNKECLNGLPTLALSRPLTAEKVEQALRAFLAPTA